MCWISFNFFTFTYIAAYEYLVILSQTRQVQCPACHAPDRLYATQEIPDAKLCPICFLIHVKDVQNCDHSLCGDCERRSYGTGRYIALTYSGMVKFITIYTATYKRGMQTILNSSRIDYFSFVILLK